MATYKKRGNKVKKGNQANIEDQSTTAEVFNTLDETASRSEQWVEKNQKIIFTGLIVVAGIILAFLAYNKYIVEPKEKEAADELAFPKKYFEQAQSTSVEVDSLYNLSLNGADGKYGLIDIVDNYGGTKAGNLAKYMSGIAFLKTGDYESAIKYLSDFSSDDEMLAALAKGNIGDAFVEIEQPEDALQYYVEAANIKDNNFTSPLYLFRAGNTAMKLGKFGEAEGYYSRIEKDYPKSEEAKNISVYIQRAQIAQK
ncbi:tetratricopeptide repeat protein [Lutimonas zeaxanthinifaciens]|uniref:tetratricopeptide repeat protein n=1 Tax=Lutimonas zeaxanthinifaciens TaxID=3060215 RepID=UPI00265C9132|nr:tetratricopeptide repeat protein [Lutimonas sp. YSD2104]WKK64793.1 tetratricopeptide repeat protein [Lutimonas sp. YSD2104]